MKKKTQSSYKTLKKELVASDIEINRLKLIIKDQLAISQRLEQKLKLQTETDRENLERMRARTELMNSISSMIKTASSALWSDRKGMWGRPGEPNFS